MNIEILDIEFEYPKGIIIDKESKSYGKEVTILRKQRGRYLVEFKEGGESYWYSRDKIREI